MPLNDVLTRIQYHSPPTEEDVKLAYLEALNDVLQLMVGREVNGRFREVVLLEELQNLIKSVDNPQ